jgi:hypothetical protein
MKKKSSKTLALIGVLIGVLLLAAAFLVMPRIARSMMAQRYAGEGQVSTGLTAVSADGTPIEPAAGAASLPENTAAQKVGNLNVSLALSPYPPKGFSSANFDVTLTDEQGQAISDARVSLDLTMPAMPMPQNQPEAQYTDKGLYQAAGRFTMRGLWRIEVIIERGGQTQSAFFDVGL